MVFHKDTYLVLHYSTYTHIASYADNTAIYAVNEKSQSLVNKKYLHHCFLNNLRTTL